MDFILYLSGLRARFRLFAAIVTTAVLAALVVSLLLPKSYIARATLLSDGRTEQALNPQSNVFYNERERSSYLQTQADILASPAVARQVAIKLKLADQPELRAAHAQSRSALALEDWIGQQLLGNLQVDTNQSSLIKVAYSATDPIEAARLANAFAQAYVERVLALRTEPLKQASAWLETQTEALRQRMEAARARLVEFEREQGILANDERNDQAVVRLESLTAQAASAPAAADLNALINGYVDAELRNNRNIEQLKARLAEAQARLQALSSQFGGSHPSVIRQSAEAASINAQLESEMRAVTALANRRAAAARQRSQALSAEVATQRKRVAELREARSKLDLLRGEFSNAQRVYDQARQRSIASEVDSRALMANVSVLSEATPPATPDRPRLALNLGLALVIGSLLGLAAVYFLEVAEHRLRRIDELAGNHALPLLAVLNADQAPAFPLLAGPAPAMPGGFQRAITGPEET